MERSDPTVRVMRCNTFLKLVVCVDEKDIWKDYS